MLTRERVEAGLDVRRLVYDGVRTSEKPAHRAEVVAWPGPGGPGARLDALLTLETEGIVARRPAGWVVTGRTPIWLDPVARARLVATVVALKRYGALPVARLLQEVPGPWEALRAFWCDLVACEWLTVETVGRGRARVYHLGPSCPH